MILLAYGASRLLPGPGHQAPPTASLARVRNLFDPFSPIGNSTDWLLGLDDDTFAAVARGLKGLLALETDDRLVRNRRAGRVDVQAFGLRVPLEDLSDGYQSVVALATDLMISLLAWWPSVEAAEGTVLIDELGAHLHPRWRMRIVPSLRQVFPRVQFLSSTHDPLCLRGLGDGEVVVVKPDESGEVVAVTDLPSIAGLRVDQLLTSEHFGMNSTIDPELDALFAEYYLLKAKPRLTATERRRLASRAEGGDEAEDLRDLGASPRRTGGHVIRVRLPDPPPDLLDRGAIELTSARLYFGDLTLDGEPFAFAAYKLDPVKDALNTASGFKCAYCESFFGATQPLDVEHFRPKSGVLVGADLTWGVYHWLDASWGNLLPSCTDCNRPRRQALPDGRTQTLGKANQFPIVSEAKRAMKEGEERGEARLLIHPSLDRPESHLAFTADGIVSWKSPKCRESIRVYALLRRGLVQARKGLQLEILTHLKIARGLAQKLEEDGPDSDLEALLLEELQALARFVAPSHEYSAAARTLIEPVLAELTA